MKHLDSIVMKGVLGLKVYKMINGILVLHEDWESENTIVTDGKEKLCILLASGASTAVVDQVGFGTDPTEPTIADTGLTGVYKVSISTFTYPTTTSVQFEFELGLTEYNGNTIYEYGLICNDDTLFSRKTRTGIEKKGDVLIQGTWTITFT